MADTPVASGAVVPERADRTASVQTKGDSTEYHVAEVREDGTAVILMEDGRMFTASVDEGTKLNKRSVVNVNYEKTDADGAPVDAKVSRVVNPS